MNNRVVAHFANGTVLKGQTWDFAPARATFHMTLTVGARQIPISLISLKAVFFVRDFEGDSNYIHKWNLDCDRASGKKLMITFADGEVLFGTTQGYHPEDTGFFLYPADPESNNIRVFIINSAVESVEEVE
jgi:hypothetical protein